MHLRLLGPSELALHVQHPAHLRCDAGLPELKDEIAKFYDGLSTDHVIVTSGGSEAIFSIYAALMKPGDHVIIASWADVPDEECREFEAKRVFVDGENVIRELETH